jgi:hypothetical protein
MMKLSQNILKGALLSLVLASCTYFQLKKDPEPIYRVPKYIESDADAEAFYVPEGSTLVYIDSSGNQIIRRNP